MHRVSGSYHGGPWKTAAVRANKLALYLKQLLGIAVTHVWTGLYSVARVKELRVKLKKKEQPARVEETASTSNKEGVIWL